MDCLLAYCGVNSATHRVWSHVYVPTQLPILQLLIAATSQPDYYSPRDGIRADIYAVAPIKQRLITLSMGHATP